MYASVFPGNMREGSSQCYDPPLVGCQVTWPLCRPAVGPMYGPVLEQLYGPVLVQLYGLALDHL